VNSARRAGAFRAWALTTLICCASPGCNDVLIVLYDTRAGSPEGGVPEHDGGVPSWVSLGHSDSGGGVSQRSVPVETKVVAIDPHGRPYVAWSDQSTGSWETYLAYWDGSEWVGLGGSLEPGGISSAWSPPDGREVPCVAGIGLGPEGWPQLAWVDRRNGLDSIHYKRWNGTTWEEAGGSASARGLSPETDALWWPSLAVDAAGTPAIAWEAFLGSRSAIYVKRFDGTGWVAMGGSADGDGVSPSGANAEAPKIAVGKDGLYVLWRDDRTGVDEAYLTRWDGVSWSSLGGSNEGGGISASGVSIHHSQLLLGAKGPIVAWSQGEGASSEVCLKTWTGTGWDGFGAEASLVTLGVARPASSEPSLAADASGNIIVVWTERTGADSSIHGARFNETSWSRLGPENGLVSGPSSRATWPSVATGQDGAVYVAWEEETSPGIRNVFLRVLR